MSAGTSGAGSPQASSNQVAPIKVPIKASAIDGSQDPSIIAFIKNAWKAVYSKVGQTQIMAKVKTEVSSGTLGINSKIFVKSLNAGFKYN